MKLKPFLKLTILGILIVICNSFALNEPSEQISCVHSETIMDTAIKYEFEGKTRKKNQTLFINAQKKNEGIEYAVLFIDEKFIHRSERFFNQFSKVETFKYKGLQGVFTSNDTEFNKECFKHSSLTKELYIEKIKEINNELSKNENAIGPSYSPQIYMYRHWLEKPFGSDRIEL